MSGIAGVTELTYAQKYNKETNDKLGEGLKDLKELFDKIGPQLKQIAAASALLNRVNAYTFNGNLEATRDTVGYNLDTAA